MRRPRTTLGSVAAPVCAATDVVFSGTASNIGTLAVPTLGATRQVIVTFRIDAVRLQ